MNELIGLRNQQSIEFVSKSNGMSFCVNRDFKYVFWEDN